jgi:hypothetical protein
MPAYTIAEAARYLSMPYPTLRSWFAGIDGHFRAVVRWEVSGDHRLSFSNLVEAHVLQPKPSLSVATLRPRRSPCVGTGGRHRRNPQQWHTVIQRGEALSARLVRQRTGQEALSCANGVFAAILTLCLTTADTSAGRLIAGTVSGLAAGRQAAGGAT